LRRYSGLRPVQGIVRDDGVADDQRHFIRLNAELAKKWADSYGTTRNHPLPGQWRAVPIKREPIERSSCSIVHASTDNRADS
jgi:hypothetical protein